MLLARFTAAAARAKQQLKIIYIEQLNSSCIIAEQLESKRSYNIISYNSQNSYDKSSCRTCRKLAYKTIVYIFIAAE